MLFRLERWTGRSSESSYVHALEEGEKQLMKLGKKYHADISLPPNGVPSHAKLLTILSQAQHKEWYGPKKEWVRRAWAAGFGACFVNAGEEKQDILTAVAGLAPKEMAHFVEAVYDGQQKDNGTPDRSNGSASLPDWRTDFFLELHSTPIEPQTMSSLSSSLRQYAGVVPKTVLEVFGIGTGAANGDGRSSGAVLHEKLSERPVYSPSVVVVYRGERGQEDLPC